MLRRCHVPGHHRPGPRRRLPSAPRGLLERSLRCVLRTASPLALCSFMLLFNEGASAQSLPSVTISVGDAQGPEQMVPALKLLLLLTVLSLAPALLITVTSFTRIVVVLSFARQALGTNNVPPTQVVMALALLLTAVVMAPVAQRVNQESIEPYMSKQIDERQAFGAASRAISAFLLPQTRSSDLRLFYDVTTTRLPDEASDVPLYLLVPAFMLSELRSGFEMGFLLFLPFVLVDLVVSSLLTAMGMVMLPPTMISTPLKILLFVAVDGWALLTRSVVASFA
ncbi:MAG: flagellar type III secretion system pore protein FliP [Proteobacteria bacterium]|nr:flagellar type III secretion system pore protein FliP [Pseudomonadota bacterium]